MFELLTGENPFHVLADQALSASPEWDRSQFELAVDRAILSSDPDVSLIVSSKPEDDACPRSLDVGLISQHPSAASLSAAESRRRSLQPSLTPGGSTVMHHDDSGSGSRSPIPGARSFSSLAMALSPTAISRRLSMSRGGSATPSPRMTNTQLARDLARRLLCKDPTQRIGWGGAQEIMQHEWFADMCWGTLDTLPPPWCPETEINMKSQTEMGQFADEKESSRLNLDAQDQAHYADWNFASSTAFQDEIVEFLLYEEIKVRNFVSVHVVERTPFRARLLTRFCCVLHRDPSSLPRSLPAALSVKGADIEHLRSILCRGKFPFKRAQERCRVDL
jgi:serine/threonine protein kinase